MAKSGKKITDNRKLIDSKNIYALIEAFELMEKTSRANFDETIELHVRLGVDSRHADQQIRGSVILPKGTGKKIRILVFAKSDKIKEAQNAGADYVGNDELITKIEKENWFEFDIVVATPDMMASVGKLGKILGPKGLMPNPKSGTVTFELDRAISEIKAGKIEFRIDKTSIVHVSIGKSSFSNEDLIENYKIVMESIVKSRPSAAKGQYIKSIYLSSTMGPSIRVANFKND